MPACLHENREYRMMFDGAAHYLDPVRPVSGVLVVPRFPNGDLLLVTKLRVPVVGLSFEFPRGELSPGEFVLGAAVRELALQANIAVPEEQAEEIGVLAPATDTLNTKYVVVRVDIGDVTQPEGAACSAALRTPRAQFEGHVRQRDILDGMTLAAYTMLLFHESNGKAEHYTH